MLTLRIKIVFKSIKSVGINSFDQLTRVCPPYFNFAMNKASTLIVYLQTSTLGDRTQMGFLVVIGDYVMHVMSNPYSTK